MMLALFLLILAGAQGNSGQDRNMPEKYEHGTLVSALKDFGHSLECFGGIVHDSLSSQAESRDALQVFGDLLRQSLKVHSNNSDALAELGRLSNKIQALEADYRAKNEENDRNLAKVKSLEMRLQESQELVKGLEEQVKLLNKTVAAQKNSSEEFLECGAQQPVVKKVVEKYNKTGHWNDLSRGLLESAYASNKLAVLQAQNMQSSFYGPLFEVARRGYDELVSLLLCHGLTGEFSGWNHYTMLHGAAYGGQLRLVQLLVRAGADLESRDTFDRTPLMYAAEGGSLEVTRWLVTAGADPRLTAYDGSTAVDLARRERQHVVAEYLSSLNL